MKDIRTFYNDIESNYETYTERYIEIDENNLNKDLIQHASFYSFIGALVAHGKKIKEEVEFEFETKSFEIREEAQKKLIAKGIRATKDALDTSIGANDELKTLKLKLIKAEYRYNLCRGLYSALEHRRDMLVQTSSNRRSELKIYSTE